MLYAIEFVCLCSNKHEVIFCSLCDPNIILLFTKFALFSNAFENGFQLLRKTLYKSSKLEY